MANELYKTLIGEFLTAAGVKPETISDSDVVEFVYEDFVAHICPLPDESRVLLEVQICQCDLDNVDDNFPRLLLLHQLNAAARFTHGAVATIDGDDMLIVSQTLRLSELDGDELAAALDGLLDVAAVLRRAWETLEKPESETAGADQASDATAIAGSELERLRQIREMP